MTDAAGSNTNGNLKFFEIKGNRRYSSQAIVVADSIVYSVQMEAAGLRSSLRQRIGRDHQETTIKGSNRVTVVKERTGCDEKYIDFRNKSTDDSEQSAAKSLFERQVGRGRLVVCQRMCVKNDTRWKLYWEPSYAPAVIKKGYRGVARARRTPKRNAENAENEREERNE